MANITALQKELVQQRARLKEMEAQYVEAQEKQFSTLPSHVGLKTVDELIKALVPFASPRLKGKLNSTFVGNGKTGGSNEGGKATAPKGKRRTRAKITDETRADVKKLVKAGKTGAEIAETLKISVPSVQSIKKALGLVRKRS